MLNFFFKDNYTEINNECSIRVYLKDLRYDNSPPSFFSCKTFNFFINSDPQCPTLISIENQIVEKNVKQPIQLFTNNYIKFFCNNNDIILSMFYQLFKFIL